MLLDYRKAVAALQAAQAGIAALPDTTGSLAQLDRLRNEPALNELGQDERARFAQAFNAKLAAIGAQATEAAIAGLSDIEVAQLSDLKKLQAYALAAGGTIPDPGGRERFKAAHDHSVLEAATRLLPQFQSRLDAMPISADGVGQANTAVARLTGIDDDSRLVALQPLRDAADKRVDAIVLALREQACGGLLSDLGASGDSKQEVWDGANGIKLGDMICGLAERGASVSVYSGGGLFSSTAVLKVNMPGSALQTFSLHKAEVLPGRQMLVGFEMQDANQKRALTVEEWAAFAGMAGFVPLSDIDGCQRFANTEPEKIPAPARPYWLQCVLQIAGMGERGRPGSPNGIR